MTRTHLLSNGEHAHALIEHQLKALVDWHGPVLANNDPEALHQLRVTMRRLRVCLELWDPVLHFPKDLRHKRLARTSRRLGLARDLDVLQQRLEQQVLPLLPEGELELLKPVLRQLRRERRQAHEQVAEQLRSGAYLGWLAQMQRWLRKPAFTPLADEPLAQWLLQWQLGSLSGLMLHPAWWFEHLGHDKQRDGLHDLRKQIKRLRYQLEACKPLLSRQSRRGLRCLKQAQELLGEINDLHVLQHALYDQLAEPLPQVVPQLALWLDQSQSQAWQHWRSLATATSGPGSMQQLLVALQRDQRRAQLLQRVGQLCSGLHRLVICDWRAVVASR